MQITIEIGSGALVQRKTRVTIRGEELARVHLHVTSAKERNRSAYYMRRHPIRGDEGVTPGPNSPLRTKLDKAKKPISKQIDAMRRTGLLPCIEGPFHVGMETYYTERSMLAVPISDLVANLLRPCFHRNKLGLHRLFYLEGEPITERTYRCLCFFDREKDKVALRQVRFDPGADRAFDVSGADLLDEGLVWAAALVPLVVEGRALSPVEIAVQDYDLRQILGRNNDEQIAYAYEGWFDEWDRRVREAVSGHERQGNAFESFYHSYIGLDRDGNIFIGQQEATLPALARELADRGIVAAGILDSGGSCAIYDVWMASYLNHGWYFRENRGAILVFELLSSQRLPRDDGTWIQHRRKV